MNIDELKKAAEAVAGWGNCTDAWETIDDCEYKTATVGHISDDDEKYPVIEIDCAQYYADHDSIKLAQFIALANPATILYLLAEREKLLKVMEAAADLSASHRLAMTISPEPN